MTENESEKTQKELIVEPTQSTSYQSIGQTLKAARLDKGMDIDHVCNQLNLSNHVIEALESDNYEGLPEIAYVRGYIVSYCRLLNLDSFQILQQLVTNDPELSVSHSMSSSIGSHQQNNFSLGFFKKLIPLILLLLIGVFGFFLYQQKDNLPMIGDYFNSESTTSEDLSANLNANDDGNSVSSDKKNIEQAEDEETDVNVSTESPTQNTVDEEKESLLELEFNAVAWVDIQNAQKEKVVYQSFPRGEKHQIKADLPLNIFIDNAESVFLRYEGRLIDLKPYIDEGYAKFTLSE